MAPKRSCSAARSAARTLLLSTSSEDDPAQVSSTPKRPRPGPSHLPDDFRDLPHARPLTVFDFSSCDEDSDDDADYRPRRQSEEEGHGDSSCSEDEQEDYVGLVDTTLESDEPLSAYVDRRRSRNEPGTPSFVWRKRDNFPRKHAFAAHPGVKADLDGSSTPLEIFRCLFPEDLLLHIITETNLYAETRPPPSSSHMRKWTPLSREEFSAYMGLRVNMGLQPRSNYRDYWSTDEHLRSYLYSDVMARDRFDHLTSHLHFAHLEEGEGVPADRLWKLRPVIDSLDLTFKSTLVPDKDIAIDESLWKFRGRLGFITFNPSKRARFGLKVYKLCASTGPSSGYTSCFRIYTGQDRGDVPAGTKVVLELMEKSDCLGRGYSVFVDNWYTSPSLFHMLQERRTNAVGTARINRKWMPKDFTALRRGEMDYRSTPTGMLCVQWHDRKVVTVLSTVHRASVDGDGKPHAILDYNVGMKGVDVGDQLSASYPTTRRSRVWYRKVFFFLFDLAVVNAFAVHRTLGGQNSQKEFRLKLGKLLIGGYRYGNAPMTRRTALDEGVLPGQLPPQTRARRPHSQQPALPGSRLRCRVCSRNGIQRRTKTRCITCGVGLCQYDCFDEWHDFV
ncbi:piggyBac transposable element-derived protein 4-like [Penaeus japonicus]|uniref:piggyBac transposable element-derived protein 4-like n=1 Tax=Penaeus japonicus TaxID=27405 RepID=UPI001C70D6D6|nr:piggyBac transposable element-derived protein 4-like [Penaeus japonicus]